MRRTLLPIALFLLLGAIANIGVAWGIALYSRQSRLTHPFPPAPQWRELIHAPQDWPEPTTPLSGNSGLGFWVAEAGTLPPGASMATHYCWEGRFGFPLVSMRSNLDWNVQSSSRISRGLRVPWWLVDLAANPTTLPLRPLPLAFVFDTAIYASLLFYIHIGYSLIRRTLRLRRHLCPHCAYPLGQSPTCTECGAALPAPRATTP